jgi:2-polyprenyl-3-methyl-5-hydroxy-6-metoxy-1,4-benzoquinol methylase
MNPRRDGRIDPMQTVVCNLCGADQPETLGNMHDIAFETPGEFSLVRCRNCGLVYYRTRPTPEEIQAFYPADYLPYRPAIQDEPFFLMRWARQRNVNKRRRVVEQASPKLPGCILDVGCSTGIFLDAMRRAGWQTQGIEISPQAADYARQRFGLDVYTGQLQDTQFEDESFDAITFWDVIEHTFDPLETLHETHRLLKPGGILAMTLPHWESLDHRWFGKQWIGYDTPRHLYVFPTPVLKKMLEKAGFVVLSTQSGLGGYYTFLASLRLWLKAKHGSKTRQRWMRLLEVPGVRFFFQPFFSLADALDQGGTLVVVGRKVVAE